MADCLCCNGTGLLPEAIGGIYSEKIDFTDILRRLREGENKVEFRSQDHWRAFSLDGDKLREDRGTRVGADWVIAHPRFWHG